MGRLSADVNSASKADETTDAVKTMIESKTVRSTAAVPYAEQVETASEQPAFENQLNRSQNSRRRSDDERLADAAHSLWRGVGIRTLSSLFSRPTCPPEISPQQERARALMLPSSCLDGSVTPVGPGQNSQYTGAVTDGRLWVAHNHKKKSPNNHMAAEQATFHSQPASQEPPVQHNMCRWSAQTFLM